jgi:hypothetical protein
VLTYLILNRFPCQNSLILKTTLSRLNVARETVHLLHTKVKFGLLETTNKIDLLRLEMGTRKKLQKLIKRGKLLTLMLK